MRKIQLITILLTVTIGLLTEGSIFGVGMVQDRDNKPETIKYNQGIDVIIEDNHLKGPVELPLVDKNVKYSFEGFITGYSSTVHQTDNTPFTTASGKKVRDGIVANNYLPFGTKIKIPELFGEKVFVVEDRMNKRFGKSFVDIWFPSTQEAINFGIKKATVFVLE
ncbi:hypothetical protein HRbin34_00276 [bacterium HR34]|nr:hypothetical protein HRbin34_00276 [bacterium HR34]